MPDNVQLTIALITSATSLIVAFLGIIVSLVNSRNSARATKEVERLKFDLAKSAAKNAISDAHFNESVKALQVAIQSIQILKDQIQIILNASARIFNPQILVQDISDARTRMFSSYEEQMVNLGEEEGKLFHKAKNTSFHIEQIVKEALIRDGNSFKLVDKEKTKLKDIRAELTEIQQILRDKRAGKVMERLGINDANE